MKRFRNTVRRRDKRRTCFSPFRIDWQLMMWLLKPNLNKLLTGHFGGTLSRATFVRFFVRSFVRSFVRCFVRSFVDSFVRRSVRPFVRSFVRSFVCSFIRSLLMLNLNTDVNFPTW
jgi:hypothetical protein